MVIMDLDLAAGIEVFIVLGVITVVLGSVVALPAMAYSAARRRRFRKQEMEVKKFTKKQDDASDKKRGIKEGSKKDIALDKKRGVPDRDYPQKQNFKKGKRGK